MDWQVHTAPEAFKRCLDGYALVFAMSQEGRETWYRIDVAQLNEERQRLNATALDPNSQETGDQLHTGGQPRKVISVL